MVDELVASGMFDFGVVDEDIVEAARRNLVKGGGGMLRFGIDELNGGRTAIRVFPSRVLATPSSSSPLSIGQKVEAYIAEANRRELLDEKALVPCVVLVCSVWCGVARPCVELQIRSESCMHPDPAVQSASSSALAQSRAFIDLHNVSACGQVKACWQPPNPAKSDSDQRASPKQVRCMYPSIAVLEQHLTS